MNEQVEKLATALLNGGIASNKEAALQKAREMLNIPLPKEEQEPVPLEKVDNVVVDKDFTSDKSLKELLDEDGKKVYKKD